VTRPRRRVWLCLALLLVAAAPAAQEARRTDAVLSAFAFADLVPGAALRLDPRDDGGDDPALLPDFAEGLRLRGHRIDPAATLAMSFDLAADDSVALPGRGPGSESLVLPLATPGARLELGADVSLHFRMTVPLGEAGDGRPHTASRTTSYRLSVELDDRRARRRVWSAELLFAADQRMRLEIARALLPLLLDSLGRSVDRLSVSFE